MLTEVACKNASCPADKKRLRLTDAGSLYLEISPAGSKRWFWKFSREGKEGRLALGSYPAVSLKEARAARDAAKQLHAAGGSPVQKRKHEKLQRSMGTDSAFRTVAAEWYAKQLPHWSDSHAVRVQVWIEKDLCTYIGDKPMENITPLELLAAVQRVEDRGAVETAHRVLQVASQVWTYWLPTAPVTQRNIAEGLQARLKPYRGGKFPAITDPARLGELLRAMRQYQGGIIVKTALLLAPLAYQRPGNLREMEWCELDLDRGLWTIPSAKMKRTRAEKENGEDHIVPLPRQAIELLQGIQPMTGHRRYVFTNERSYDRPISGNSVRSALYSLGFGTEQSWHGFRATARTMLVDELNLDPLAIEANLAHAVKDANGRSYNRTTYLQQRMDMVQKWADYLDRLERGKRADVLNMPRRVTA